MTIRSCATLITTCAILVFAPLSARAAWEIDWLSCRANVVWDNEVENPNDPYNPGGLVFNGTETCNLVWRDAYTPVSSVCTDCYTGPIITPPPPCTNKIEAIEARFREALLGGGIYSNGLACVSTVFNVANDSNLLRNVGNRIRNTFDSTFNVDKWMEIVVTGKFSEPVAASALVDVRYNSEEATGPEAAILTVTGPLRSVPNSNRINLTFYQNACSELPAATNAAGISAAAGQLLSHLASRFSTYQISLRHRLVTSSKSVASFPLLQAQLHSQRPAHGAYQEMRSNLSSGPVSSPRHHDTEIVGLCEAKSIRKSFFSSHLSSPYNPLFLSVRFLIHNHATLIVSTFTDSRSRGQEIRSANRSGQARKKTYDL